MNGYRIVRIIWVFGDLGKLERSQHHSGPGEGAVVEDWRENGRFNLATARLNVGEYRQGEVLLARIVAAGERPVLWRPIGTKVPVPKLPYALADLG